ncbi:MAG: hypothetical protein HPY45_00465 [Anaerolineae bacterium]|nr:hypothetical protein [Anaerolineae bacterium]
MELRPSVNTTLTINDQTYTFTEHPAAKGMPYGQSGRRATVYQLSTPDGGRHAIKIFNLSFREARIAEGVERMAPFASLPGLQVCRRLVLTPQQHGDLLEKYENLLYAVVMPWVYGENWQEFILSGKPLTVNQSRLLAKSLAAILARMEAEGLAHCDLSAPNVLLPGLQTSSMPTEGKSSLVALVDVEDMYAPGFPRPQVPPSASSGYAHRTTKEGNWSAEGDRFAGAVLLAEMLGWCDKEVRQAAYGEQYFDLEETQCINKRYEILVGSLYQNHGAQISDLFTRAWESSSLKDCPTFAEWQQALEAPYEAAPQPSTSKESTMTIEAPPPPPPKAETPQERLVRSAVERAQIYLGVGQTDKALHELEEAYRLAPAIGGRELARVLLQVAEGKERTGDLQGALIDYQRALAVAPPGGMRDELHTIVAEVSNKIQLAQGAAVVTTAAPPTTPFEAVYTPAPTSPPSLSPSAPTPTKKRNWVLWALLGAGLLAVILCVVGVLVILPQTDWSSINVAEPQTNPAIPTTNPLIQTQLFASPTPTNPPPLPGKVIIPIENMARSIPWLELELAQTPTSRFIVFNTRMPPFDNVLVRKAFSAAIHRQGVADFAKNLYGYDTAPLTTLTPPQVLGRDLYREVGIRYDLEQARFYLAQAGYPKGEGLPPVAFSLRSASGACDDPATPAIQLARYLVSMWSQLGVDVSIDCYTDAQKFSEKRQAGAFQFFSYGWAADYNDPDNFLNTLFLSTSESNPGFFADARFDQLVQQAAGMNDPLERQRLYIEAEKILTEEQAAIIPLYAHLLDASENAPTPTSPAVQSPYFFSDDFSTKKWKEGTDNRESWGYEGEEYFIHVFERGFFRWVTPPVDFSPQVIEFDVRISDKSKNNQFLGYYGAMCRIQDNSNFYVVEIDPFAQAYQIELLKDNKFKPLIAWKTLTNLETWGTNHMALDCTGTNITLLINDKLIDSLDDTTLPADGGVAIMTGNQDKADPQGFRVMFDNFTAYRHVQ